MDTLLAAARFGDPIAHTASKGWMIAGMIAGAVIGAVAVVATGGAALTVIAAVAAGAAAGGGLGEVLGTMSWAPRHVTGSLIKGSPNVFINSRPAIRAILSLGLCSDHAGPPQVVAQGSSTVFINSQPASRKEDRMMCGALINDGSPNVFIGGPAVGEFNPEIPAWVNWTMAAVGIAAAAVLAGPALAFLGAAGGFLGGEVGGWLGGKIFGEGSDGQKWSMLGGSLLGGFGAAKGAGLVSGARGAGSAAGELSALEAAEGAAGATEQPTISLFGVRGGGRVSDVEGGMHPYQYTGHVGYSLDGGKTIWGFGPATGDASAAEVFANLKGSGSYPGMITADQDAFIAIAKNPMAARGGGGALQTVYEQKIPVTQEQYESILAAHEELVARGPMDDIRYQWPPKSGEWPENNYNCATFPGRLGIPIPEGTGKLQNYMPELEKVGTPWMPGN
ncbi:MULTISPECIES: PAAR domain-containing protein [Burkholderia]|nr:PAAR domain-containing protein [Burkholderia cepacia]MBY4714133.1 PAAR domain-containing protein [Burkholderia cepacia]MBY4740158.1 PAAR domain-containing protein [Burkholderia cepacia]MBY4746731.1 PAAR domain-containing protein [Burkholderia cepacia]MBY4758139.1 PAAR domain-containing protein [Burkholderia cepacia]MBY4778459.1 PAAR domain-containing protein [Burkholderia cepacia]